MEARRAVTFSAASSMLCWLSFPFHALTHVAITCRLCEPEAKI